MGHGGGHGAAGDAKAMDKAAATGPGAVVPLKYHGLEHVLDRIGLQIAVAGGQRGDMLPGQGLSGDDADGPDLLDGLGGGGIAEIPGLDGLQMDGGADKVRIGRLRNVDGQAAVLGHQVSVDKDLLDGEILQVGEHNQIGAFSRGDGAQVVIHLEALGAVDGDHLDGGHRVDALGHRPAEQSVHMALGPESLGMGVVGDQQGKAAVHLVFGDRFGYLMEVPPAGTLPEHGVHTQAHFGQSFFRTGGLVAGAHTGGDIAVEAPVQIGHGVVAGDGPPGLAGLGQDGVGAVRAREDAGVVHHLAQGHRAPVLHELAHILRPHRAAGVLKAGDSGHAGGHGEHGFEGGGGGVLHQEGDALGAQYIADFMGIVVYTHRALGEHRPGKVPGGHHGGLDVDVAIQKAGGEVGIPGVHHLGLGPDAV